MASAEETIHVLASKNRMYSQKFKNHEVNHLLQNIVPRFHLGATPTRLYEAFQTYVHGEPCLEPWPNSTGQVNKDNWQEFFGKKQYYADYTEFFDGELLERGTTKVIQEYVPILIEGLSGELFHPLIHLGLGLSINCNPIIAEGLAYMAYAYHSLGKLPQINPLPLSKSRIAKVMQVVKNSVTFDNLFTRGENYEQQLELLAREKSDELLKNAKQWEMQSDETTEAAKILSHAVTFLYNLVGVKDYVMLHLVLAVNALKPVIAILKPEQAVAALRYLFLAMIAVYVAKGRPILSAEPTYVDPQLANWKELVEVGIDQDIDEHISMLIWAIRVSEKEWGAGDPIFTSTAALAVKRIKSSSAYI